MISRHWSGVQPVEQAQDHGVDGDRLAGAGGAGDQQMRHAGEIDDHRLAADGLAEAERQLGLRVGVFVGRQHLAEIDLLALVVRQLDADGVAARHHGDARRQRAHRAGDVVGQPDHARRLDAGRGLELVERHHRAGPGVDDLAAHAEVAAARFPATWRCPGSSPGSARTCRWISAAPAATAREAGSRRWSASRGLRAARLARDAARPRFVFVVVLDLRRRRPAPAASTRGSMRSRCDTAGVGARRGGAAARAAPSGASPAGRCGP